MKSGTAAKRPPFPRLVTVVSLGLAGIAFMGPPALAANPFATSAALYAKHAAEATTLEEVHRNMRLTLNCLVGPGHEDFSVGLSTHCSVPDGAMADGMVSVSYRLAAQIAKTALAIDSLGGAQFAARTAERLILATDPTKPEGVDVVENAQFQTGTVDRVDAVTRTMTMGADTYLVRAADADMIGQIKPGEQVEVTYVVEDGRRIALDVRKVELRELPAP